MPFLPRDKHCACEANDNIRERSIIDNDHPNFIYRPKKEITRQEIIEVAQQMEHEDLDDYFNNLEDEEEDNDDNEEAKRIRRATFKLKKKNRNLKNADAFKKIAEEAMN